MSLRRAAPISPRCREVPREDPAGLDKLLLALGESCARWAEAKVARLGVRVELWEGKDGLGAVVQEQIKAHGIPNKRFQELVTPRAIVERIAGARPAKKRRLTR